MMIKTDKLVSNFKKQVINLVMKIYKKIKKTFMLIISKFTVSLGLFK